MYRIKLTHSILLLITAFIWGVAFVVQREGGNAVGPYAFNCLRSILGGIVLLPVIIFLDKTGFTNKKPANKSDWKKLWIAGVSCGIALCIASNIQQLGLYFGTSAGKAGFLTSCYILIVPVLGLFMKRKCGINIWIGVGIALMGLYLLCIQGRFGLVFSDALVVLCALFFSFHILLIDRFSPFVDGVRMACIQFFVCGILTAIPMFFVDMKHSMAGIAQWLPCLLSSETWVMLGYAGFLSCGVAYTLQIIGQNGLNPTVASLLMSMESVFSVLAGWIILNQTMSPRELTGCLLLFLAIIIAQIPVRNFKKLIR